MVVLYVSIFYEINVGVALTIITIRIITIRYYHRALIGPLFMDGLLGVGVLWVLSVMTYVVLLLFGVWCNG